MKKETGREGRTNNAAARVFGDRSRHAKENIRRLAGILRFRGLSTVPGTKVVYGRRTVGDVTIVVVFVVLANNLL